MARARPLEEGEHEREGRRGRRKTSLRAGEWAMKDEKAPGQRPESAMADDQQSDLELDAYRQFNLWDFPTDAKAGWRHAELPLEEVYQTRDPEDQAQPSTQSQPPPRQQVRVTTGTHSPHDAALSSNRYPSEPPANIDPPTPVCLPPPPPST